MVLKARGTGTGAASGRAEARARPGLEGRRDKTVLMLRSAEDLGLFIGRRRWFGRPGEIVLRLPALDPAERDKAQARLNFWNQVCGCLPGGLAVLAATVWKAIALARAPAPGPAALAAAMATVLLLGIAAKIAALALARAMLVLEIGRLRRRLAAQADPPGE